jgi:hypothetical protein
MFLVTLSLFIENKEKSWCMEGTSNWDEINIFFYNFICTKKHEIDLRMYRTFTFLGSTSVCTISWSWVSHRNIWKYCTVRWIHFIVHETTFLLTLQLCLSLVLVSKSLLQCLCTFLIKMRLWNTW